LAFTPPYPVGTLVLSPAARSPAVIAAALSGRAGIALPWWSVGHAVRRQLQSVQSRCAALYERALGVAARSLNPGARARRDEYGQARWYDDQRGSAGYHSQRPFGETYVPDRAPERGLLSDAGRGGWLE